MSNFSHCISSSWCNNNNVTIIASYPSTYYYNEYSSEEYVNAFNLINNFYEKRGISVLGNASDFFYDNVSLFYNSIYHLNNKGRKINTDKIISMLQEEGVV